MRSSPQLRAGALAVAEVLVISSWSSTMTQFAITDSISVSDISSLRCSSVQAPIATV